MRIALAALLIAGPACAVELERLALQPMVMNVPPGFAQAQAQSLGAPKPVMRGIIRVVFESEMQLNDRESVMRAAAQDRGLKVLVDKRTFELRLMRGDELLFIAPVAVGSGKSFESRGRRFDFDTPIGKRVVRAKQADPTWVPPEWHYYERGEQLDLEVVALSRSERYPVSGGRWLEVRGDEVGLIDEDGEWLPMELGEEIIFDDTLFIPPFGTKQRRRQGVLGPFKLDMGGGYLIHGTNKGTERSIGQAASHGCVRMANDRLTELYPLVPVGTPVYIY